MLITQTKTHSHFRVSWNLKSCPRCNGDVFQEDNSYTCLQCGYIIEKNSKGEVMSHYKDVRLSNPRINFVPVVHSSSEDERLPNFKDDIIVKLAMRIQNDQRILATSIVSFLESHHFPVTSENTVKVYNSLLNTFPQVPESITNELQSIIDIEQKKIGTILRLDYLLGKTQCFVLINNEERNLASEEDVEQQGLDVKEHAVCPNPYCNLMGQFYFTGKDGKYDYYCPACKITWHIEWR